MTEKSSNAHTATGPPASGPPTTRSSNTNTTSPNPYSSLANVTASQVPAQSYQPYTHLNWQHAWTMNSLYTGGPSTAPQNAFYAQQAYAPYQSPYYSVPVPPTPSTTAAAINAVTVTQNTTDANVKSRTPSPPPPQYDHWDEAFREFLQKAGLTQTLKAFECDMLVMNSDWEQTGVQFALEHLTKALRTTKELQSQKGKAKESVDESLVEPKEENDDRSLEERKLDYVRPVNGEKPRSQTSINKEISTFLAKNRLRNDASNRSEFLLSLSEKRKHLQELDDPPEDNAAVSSCARTDARVFDRDAQMKYDIAKNDEGPLRRTKAKKDEKYPASSKLNIHTESPLTSDGAIVVPNDQESLPKDHPGVDERLGNIESHLAVRYVPSPPRTLWARLKFLEDHIVRLEKDYPPWAALHFNQPNRGWPPPPRATPIIVPPHLRSSDLDTSSTTKADVPDQQGSSSSSLPALGNQKARNTKSSLQRAIIEKLEVQQAMEEKMDSSS